MSHILLKKVQDNLISAPALNYVKFFSNDNDNGLLYYMNSSGNAVAVGAGSYNTVISITYSSLYSLYSSDGFATGSYYNITDFETIYEQPDFYFDSTPKSVLDNKTAGSSPIFVLATSKDTLAPDAYQPNSPKDKIKYDITWNVTELGNNAKGRITEKIDQFGNRADYDHRTILYKRYLEYEKDTLLTGTITDWNCVSGTVSGSGTLFNTELSIGDVILLDTSVVSGGDLDYTIGLKVKNVVNDTTITVEVDSLYTGSVPSPVVLGNGASINPIDYTFTGKNYTFWIATSTGNYSSHKEFYFSQSDENEYDELHTFPGGTTCVDNYIGNYSNKYLSGAYNNTLILSNNVFENYNTYRNNILGLFYNNTIQNSFYNNSIFSSFYNNICSHFYNNNIKCTDFNDNFISGDFKGNSISGQSFNFNDLKSMTSNSISSQFSQNVLDDNFSSNIIESSHFTGNTFGATAGYNNIYADITDCIINASFRYNDIKFGCNLTTLNLTTASVVYASPQTKTLYRNENGDVKIMYYDSTDTLIRSAITA